MRIAAGIPSEVLRAAAGALQLDTDVHAIETVPLGGGCICPAAKLGIHGRDPVFLKWGRKTGASGFTVEAGGLAALTSAGAGALRAPQVLAFAEGTPGSYGWLLLEFIEPGRATPATEIDLGQGLAALHRPASSARPGWDVDGWIGALPQRNVPGEQEERWPAFWRDARLQAQWELAARYFDQNLRRRWDRLVGDLETALAGWESDGMSILHGDLWSGNVLTDVHGSPVLVDPAVYRGHREVDLAMMELFGGFGPSVFAAYCDRTPLAPGYREVRRDVYQLYPLLVHVNLFGATYAAGVRSRVDRLVAELALT